MNLTSKLALAAIPVIFLAGAQCEQTADQKEREKTAQLTADASMQVGLPAITNFTEKKLVKWLYELRDEPNFRTYAYIITLNGDFVKICDSVGYGISASTQFTNPERVSALGGQILPQAEPNALFMPTGLAATYVMCVVPGADDVRAVYIEQDVLVSPFPLGGGFDGGQ